MSLYRLYERLRRRCVPPSGNNRSFLVQQHAVGQVRHETAERLKRWPDIFSVMPHQVEFAPGLTTPTARTDAITHVAHAMHRDGLVAGWRNESVAVAAVFGEAPLFHIERAALRHFGLTLHAVHLNALTDFDRSGEMWLARRSHNKATDPGCYDTIVGGGLGNGMGITATLIKECFEEAGMPADLASQARPAGAVHVRREVPEGVHDEILFTHDLVVSKDFVPNNHDGEVQEFVRLPLQDVIELIGSSDEVTVEASFVITDFLLRSGFISPDVPGYLPLCKLVHRGEKRAGS
ncbi:DUF4743 domain-containing protein [Noviherbaspirillum saxi]|uniref:DUF4743 domain-containing protein n=1 Tax=Noviherbaspirillum saxi TaxID=2320863 RepID=A0A3A3GB04_9BURK|nr:DUF4743 domain-containing protein [Noviherbaspirillum saxi]RJF98059.1 DUF4743 domain-containing protein [Noviherbaspirillum saxi]